VVLFECIGVGCDSVMELALKSGRDPSTARAGALETERRKKPARSDRDDNKEKKPARSGRDDSLEQRLGR
jgi:hypothetical protein